MPNLKSYPVSKLCLGTVALGIPYVVFDAATAGQQEDPEQLIQAAYQAGITCFDTAREYGTAEQLLGNTLSKADTPNAFVVSKFKFSAAALQREELAIAEAERSVRESLKQLKLDRLPLCLFHMVSSFDPKQIQTLLPKVFTALREKGLIDLAGVSLDHPLEIQYFIDNPLYAAFQIPMNILDQRLLTSEYWERLVQGSAYVFIRSVFLKGLLLQDPERLTGNLQEAKPYLQTLQSLASEANMSVQQLCFSYIRDLLPQSSVVIGPDKLIQLQENIQLAEGAAVPEAIAQRAAEAFAAIPEHILTPRLWKM